MNDSPNQNLSRLPFFVLALLSAIAVFDARKPLDSLRPPQPARPAVGDRDRAEAQQAEQRTWEDPFKFDFFDDGLLVEADFPQVDPALPSMLLPVTLPGGGRVNIQERRGRRRYAVHLALGQAGYRARSSGSIFAVTLESAQSGEASKLVPAALEVFELDPLSRRWYGSPVEVKGASAASVNFDGDWSAAFAKSYHTIVVAYLRSGDLAGQPLTRLETISDNIKSKVGCEEMDTRIIGPDSSNLVFDLLQELTKRAAAVAEESGLELSGKSNAFLEFVARLEDPALASWIAEQERKRPSMFVFSPTATSDFATLLGQDSNAKRIRSQDIGYKPIWQTDKNADLARARRAVRLLSGVNYIRAVHNDSAVFAELIEELKLRAVLEDQESLSRVALIVESDTRYGRAAPVNFLKGAQSVEGFETLRDPDRFTRQMESLRVFSYLSGIDGVSGSSSRPEAGQEGEPKRSDRLAGNARSFVDPPPQGSHQIDYVRRLADQIASASGSSDRPIRAIGILGTDIFDKLLLMRALKPLLPDVVFFTSDLDAHLWYSTEIEFTRNLVVGSSHSLALTPEIQQLVPPFRDAYQTSIFTSVLMAANAIRHPYEIDRYKPQVFEIGFDGPVYLRGGSYTSVDGDETGRALFDVRDPASRGWINFSWFVFSLCLLFLTVVSERAVMRFDQELCVAARRAFGFGKLVVAAVLLLGMLANLFVVTSALEPISLSSGVSAWPAFFLNIFGTFLALCFCAYITMTRSASIPRVLGRYACIRDLTSFRGTGKLIGDLRGELYMFIGFSAAALVYGALFQSVVLSVEYQNFKYWLSLPIVVLGGHIAWRLWADVKSFSESLPDGDSEGFVFDSRYLRSFAFPLFLFMMLTFIWGIASGYNFLPIRSLGLQTVFGVTQLFQTTSMLTLLSFVVFEAVWITALIGRLCRREHGETRWDPHGLLVGQRSSILRRESEAERELSRATRCIYFVSQLTEIPNRYLFFPFVVLFLSILGQQREFDGWAWSEYRWVITGLLFGFSILPAALMRVMATSLRSQACRSFAQLEIEKRYKQTIGSEGNTPKDIVADLQSIRRGAYAPFFSQPLVLAALTPMGGLGSLALLRLIIESF